MPKLIYFCFTSKNKHFPWRTEDCLCLRACVVCKCTWVCVCVCVWVRVLSVCVCLWVSVCCCVSCVVFVELQLRRSVSRWRWLDDFWLLGRQLPLLPHAIATSNRQTENLTRSFSPSHSVSFHAFFHLSLSLCVTHATQIVIVTRVCHVDSWQHLG